MNLCWLYCYSCKCGGAREFNRITNINFSNQKVPRFERGANSNLLSVLNFYVQRSEAKRPKLLDLKVFFDSKTKYFVIIIILKESLSLA